MTLLLLLTLNIATTISRRCLINHSHDHYYIKQYHIIELQIISCEYTYSFHNNIIVKMISFPRSCLQRNCSFGHFFLLKQPFKFGTNTYIQLETT